MFQKVALLFAYKLLGAPCVEHAHDPSHYLLHSGSRFIPGLYSPIDTSKLVSKPVNLQCPADAPAIGVFLCTPLACLDGVLCIRELTGC